VEHETGATREQSTFVGSSKTKLKTARDLLAVGADYFGYYRLAYQAAHTDTHAHSRAQPTTASLAKRYLYLASARVSVSERSQR